jgi:hypothetical protein
MFLMLGVVVFFTMLGFMGLQLAERDSGLAGSVLDLRSRDVATRSGMSLALELLKNNSANTATILNSFIADSTASDPREWLNFTTSPMSIVASEPGWYAVGEGADESAVKVRVVSLDIGTATGAPSDGIRLTLECQAKGRNADAITVLSTYRVMGLHVPQIAASTPTNNFAIYLDGAMANTNMGATVNGNVYIAGNTHLNGPASFSINGNFRTSGDFSADAPLTATGNSVIGGNIKTNGTGPMTFQKNLVVKGGIDVMNANLTVTGNLDVQGTSPMGSWNTTGRLTVGGQFWYRSECRDIGGPVTVSGNAFFDNCMRLTNNNARSFSNLYVHRAGTSGANDYINSGSATISGNFGNWHTGASSTKFQTDGPTVSIGGSAHFRTPVEQRNSGAINITGSGQFWSGIVGIASSSGIRVDGTTYIYSTDQQGDYNGGMSLGNTLTMRGAANGNFGQNGSPRRWAFQSTAASKAWYYQKATCFDSTATLRVTNATGHNRTGCNSGATAAGVPSANVTAPTPVSADAFAADPFTSEDLDVDRTQLWNQPQTSDFTKISGIIDLRSDSLTAAGCNTDNITVADMHKMYARWKRADGWMIVRIGASSSIGSLSSPGGTFTGKALWIIEKSVNVNGNWPGSTTTNDIQFIWVRGSGSLGQFGSQSNFTGYIRYEPVMSGQLLWGTVTLTGAIHYLGDNSSVTGNGANNLTINNSQTVFDAIGTAFPGVLADPTGTSGSTSATSTRTVAARHSALQFVPVGEYR